MNHERVDNRPKAKPTLTVELSFDDSAPLKEVQESISTIQGLCINAEEVEVKLNYKEKIMTKLGMRVRDKVSGFEGVAVAKHSYLNGCSRYTIQPYVDKEGKLPSSATFDEMQLEAVDLERIEGNNETGGADKYEDSGYPE